MSNISIAFLQEAHINIDRQETTKQYLWYFTGQEKTDTQQGLSEYVFVNVYAPPAPTSDDNKDACYILLDSSIQPYHRHKHMFIQGDCNSRVQIKQDPDEVFVGNYTVDSNDAMLAAQSEEAINN
eukprot:8684555-Karenia_brevis.AAC.1